MQRKFIISFIAAAIAFQAAPLTAKPLTCDEVKKAQWAQCIVEQSEERTGQ